MKYTKGPWRLSETPKDAIFNRYLLTGPGNEIIATIHAPMAPVELPESEVEANARLISSAPDLLKALIDCQKVLFEYVHGDETPEMCAMAEGEANALEAIRRATGD